MRYLRFPVITAILVLMIVIFPLSAQGSKDQMPTAEPVVSLVDSRGMTISLQSFPQKIVSLSPNITETLFALGLGDRLVGRTDYCDYPEEAINIPAMGDLLSPSVEKIVAANPDLVIISNLGQLQTIEAIEMTGIPVAFIDEPQTMEGTFNIIEQVGKITGTTDEATAIVERMKATLADIDLPDSEERPTVYYVAGFGEWGDFTATGDTFIHDIITLAGGENIAADAVNWSLQLELLHASDPNILILPPLWGSTFAETSEQFINHPSYSSLTAVKQGNIIQIDSSLMERQGPRSAMATALLAEAIDELTR